MGIGAALRGDAMSTLCERIAFLMTGAPANACTAPAPTHVDMCVLTDCRMAVVGCPWAVCVCRGAPVREAV